MMPRRRLRAEDDQGQGDRQREGLTGPQRCGINSRPYPSMGQSLDTARGVTDKCLILLALPSGIEPLSPP
jgi:hypothetical protein